ncbi:hypothetical protein BDZ91DRAFT_285042 [Kalaharituber pfeilii]|nr:hypothetical protein BDZ91DRAFT_285042 [Kalaharituber pfeilii]
MVTTLCSLSLGIPHSANTLSPKNCTAMALARWSISDILWDSWIGGYGEFLFDLYAIDGSGEFVNGVKFIVSPLLAPIVEKDGITQPRDIGIVDSKGRLILSQGQRFSFSFSGSTFTGANGIKQYHAVSSDNTPLPAWIKFDGRHLEFSGEAPVLASQEVAAQTVGFKQVAEDYIGFEGSSTSFEVMVNYHLSLAR